VNGLSVLVHKELIESWRTYRLPVVVGLFLIIGLGSPLLAKFLPDIIAAAGGDQLGAIEIATPVAADAVTQVWKNLSQFGAFAAIILAMSSVALELDRGTAAFVLSKTVTRGAFLGGKIVVVAAVLLAATLLAVLVAWVYTAILFEPASVGGWVAMGLLAWLGLAAWAAITFLGSTVTGSAAAAAGLGFVAWLGLSILSAIPNIGRLTPGGLADPAIALATGRPIEPDDVVVPIVATVILIAVCLVAAGWWFRRREL
jgi:ABC-2 type transport system permease protein